MRASSTGNVSGDTASVIGRWGSTCQKRWRPPNRRISYPGKPRPRRRTRSPGGFEPGCNDGENPCRVATANGNGVRKDLAVGYQGKRPIAAELVGQPGGLQPGHVNQVHPPAPATIPAMNRASRIGRATSFIGRGWLKWRSARWQRWFGRIGPRRRKARARRWPGVGPPHGWRCRNRTAPGSRGNASFHRQHMGAAERPPRIRRRRQAHGFPAASPEPTDFLASESRSLCRELWHQQIHRAPDGSFTSVQMNQLWRSLYPALYPRHPKMSPIWGRRVFGKVRRQNLGRRRPNGSA